MKVILFAGGLGTRISEETSIRPKPMIEIGGKPILWHIMQQYAAFGHKEFIICLGYKGYMIKEYFLNYYYHNSDITVDLTTNNVVVHRKVSDDFKITLVETGQETMTAGRLKKVKGFLNHGEDFLLTYGDGLADLDMNKQIQFHKKHGKICTMTIVQPTSRFGLLDVDEHDKVSRFIEKPMEEGTWINGGFFILKHDVFNYLPDKSDNIMWEKDPMSKLTKDGELMAYKHTGFWKCLDTLRDKNQLDEMIIAGNMPWLKL